MDSLTEAATFWWSKWVVICPLGCFLERINLVTELDHKFLQLVETPVDVADDIERPMLGSPIRPEWLASDL